MVALDRNCVTCEEIRDWRKGMRFEVEYPGYLLVTDVRIARVRHPHLISLTPLQQVIVQSEGE